MLKRLAKKFMGNAQSEDDTEYYALIASELETGQIDPGTWAKALATSDGNDSVARSHYIKLRVAQYIRSPPRIITDARRARIEQQNEIELQEKNRELQVKRNTYSNRLHTVCSDAEIAKLFASSKKAMALWWGISTTLVLIWYVSLFETGLYIIALMMILLCGMIVYIIAFEKLRDLKQSRKFAIRQIQDIDAQIAALGDKS
jgi:hypothetical protein